MRVLVTGGAGFIGSHVVDALVARGNEVRVLDAALPAAHNGVPGYVSPDAEVIWGDLTDLETVTQAVAGVDAVSHQAAMVGLGEGSADGPAYVINNDLGTAVLLQALAATSFAGRFVLASSMVVYGEGSYSCPEHGLVRPGPRERADLDSGMFEARCPRCGRPALPVPIDESGPLDPRNVYAATKVHQEHLCSIFARETGASLVALRYHNVYGPRMPRDTPYAGVASIFRSALGRGDPPEVFEDGGQKRDFVHVADVARANLTALDSGVEGAFNVASGEVRTVAEMATALTDADGRGFTPVVSGRYRSGDVRHVFSSPERAALELGFRAQMGFEEGMAAFLSVPLRD